MQPDQNTARPEGLLAVVIGELTRSAYQALTGAEAQLCDEAGKAASHAAQNRLLATVARIRFGRLRLTDALATVIAGGEPPAIPADRAERVDLEGSLQAMDHEALFAALAPVLPVAPARLAAVLLDWTAVCDLDPQATLLVFRQFQQRVLAGLPARAREWAGEAGVSLPAETAHAVATGTAAQEALLEALDRLQAGQSAAFQAQGLQAPAQDIAAVAAHLATEGLDAGETLPLVGRLFDFILRSSRLPTGVRQLLGFLQLPVAKVALLDGSFFDREGHAARKLLNQMATASLALTDETAVAGDGMFDAMADAVGTVLAQFGREPVVFSEVLARLVSALEQESEQAMLAEERLRSAEDLGALSGQARDTVDQHLAPFLADTSLPDVVREFIDSHWRNVLFLAFQQEGATGNKWPQYTETLDELVWSVRPIAGPADRQKLLKLVPQLLKALRMGLGWAGVNQAAMDHFFRALEAVHLGQLRGKPAAAPAPVPVPDVAQATPAVAAPPTSASPEPEPAGGLDAWLALVDGLGMGVWVEFVEGDDKRFRCKLAAVIRHTGRYIFVNRSGAKVAEKGREELAADLRDGRIELMEDTRLFDRALESVIGGARGRKA